jgi:hypothetical protein
MLCSQFEHKRDEGSGAGFKSINELEASYEFVPVPKLRIRHTASTTLAFNVNTVINGCNAKVVI